MFSRDLELYGPQAHLPEPPSLRQSRRYCRRLARRHYENFTVASCLLPRRLRQHFFNIYAYCRWADDLADEAGDPEQSLALLDWWEQQLHACYRGQAPAPGLHRPGRHDPASSTSPPSRSSICWWPFARTSGSAATRTSANCSNYCRYSANPVGRLVLYLGRCHTPERVQLADSICTGPAIGQLLPGRGRRLSIAGGSTCRWPIAAASATTRRCSPAGSATTPFAGCWPPRWTRPKATCGAACRWCRSMPSELQLDVALFVHGGLAILEAIRRQNYDVWTARPKRLRSARSCACLASCWWRLLRGTLLERGGGPSHERHAGRRPVEASYAACRRLARRASSNFPAGFFLLPAAQRRAMDALYAFMRHTRRPGGRRADAASADAAGKPWPNGETDLDELPCRGRRVRRRAFACDRKPPRFCPRWPMRCGRFRIPPEHLSAVLDGVEMDLDGRDYETFAALAGYCERVASAVGLACIHVWGFRGPEALGPARAAGIALQLTNILRDLKEDAGGGRVYLPLDDLRAVRLLGRAIAAGVTGPAFRRLMELEIGRAEEFYRDGARLLDWLPPARQRLFGMMMATYRVLLRKIARRPEDVFRRRIRLSRPKKLRLAARWALLPRGPPRDVAETPQPPNTTHPKPTGCVRWDGRP